MPRRTAPRAVFPPGRTPLVIALGAVVGARQILAPHRWGQVERYLRVTFWK